MSYINFGSRCVFTSSVGWLWLLYRTHWVVSVESEVRALSLSDPVGAGHLPSVTLQLLSGDRHLLI